MSRNLRKKKKQSYHDDEDYVDNEDDDDFDAYDDDFVVEEDDHPSKQKATRKSARQAAQAKKPHAIYSALQAAETDDTTLGVAFQDLSESLTLKVDHEKRPIWITRDNIIILEAFSPYYNQAYDFLIDIAEPIARPNFFQTYRLTEDSLYSAVAVSRSTESIIKILNILCKTDVPKEVEQYIRDSTYTFGKAKLVLKDNRFYVESKFPDVLRELLRNPNIAVARLMDQENAESQNVDGGQGAGENGTEGRKQGADGFLESAAPQEDRRNLDMLRLGVEEEDEEDDEFDEEGNMRRDAKTVSFMISQTLVQHVKRCAKEESKYPLMEEYDFRADTKNPSLSIDLRPSTNIRPYQERSLSKMFGNGRARSGIIVLPCGAGKSLTGVTAASTIKKSTMVLCINNASVKQWKEQFLMWTSIPERCLKVFTSGAKEVLPSPSEACVVMTTYSMICHSGKRSESAEVMMRSVTNREWGLMLLDEVHVAPADMFQKVLQIVNAHCKLGLTATLVREDNKIKDLSFLVGPKLHEANWIDLTNQQYLARAQCVEVWCPMTKEFYAEYIRCGMNQHSRTQKLLYLLNPRKFRVCEYLVKYHVKRGDKIIIFSDDLPALFLYCSLLRDVQAIPYICGDTREEDRRYGELEVIYI
jgi:DNA excision repair protein ERCC-3